MNCACSCLFVFSYILSQLCWDRLTGWQACHGPVSALSQTIVAAGDWWQAATGSRAAREQEEEEMRRGRWGDEKRKMRRKRAQVVWSEERQNCRCDALQNKTETWLMMQQSQVTKRSEIHVCRLECQLLCYILVLAGHWSNDTITVLLVWGSFPLVHLFASCFIRKFQIKCPIEHLWWKSCCFLSSLTKKNTGKDWSQKWDKSFFKNYKKI